MRLGIKELLEARSALLADVATGPEGDRLLVRSDRSGTMQAFELEVASGQMVALSALSEPVANAAYRPGHRQVLLEMDRGGDERHQLYVLDLQRVHGDGPAEDKDLTALTDDARFGHHLAGVSPDGSLVAYTSNRANGVDFDLWVCDLRTASHRMLWAAQAWLQPGSGFDPSGRWVSVQRPGSAPLDSDLVLVALEGDEQLVVDPHPGAAALPSSPVWWEGDLFYFASDRGRDLPALFASRLGSPSSELVLERSWGIEPVDAVPRARVMAAVENAGGASRLLVFDPGAPGDPVEVPLPEPGVVQAHNIPRPRLSPSGRRLYFNYSSPRRPAEAWSFEPASGALARLTQSPDQPDPKELVPPTSFEVPSFDGERIPLWLYRPPGIANPPVVLVVHGGPESQSTLAFNPLVQGLVWAGLAVVVPNVRGSTGYGRRYASLDDTTRRLDAVADLAAVHSWLGEVGLDQSRAALWGASYGGYMVLAGLAFQPELWAGGVDIVGISDLLSFLENTSEYRRAHREREYGSLQSDRDFLAQASPLRRADAIRAPLFIIHGRNDPRVPLGEAQQIHASLRSRGVPCELLVYDDEGHGLARLANRLDAYPKAVAFLARVLRAEAPVIL